MVPTRTRWIAASLQAVILGLGCNGASEAVPPAAATRLLERPQLGYALSFPADWTRTGPVKATEFANRAACESVEVIDFRPPEGSGPTAVVLHSFVQVCAVPLEPGDAGLEAFMRRTYGDAFARQFEAVELGGVAAYRAATGAGAATIFVQTQSHRLQVVTGVFAEPDVRPRRLAQVQEILRSFAVVE